MSNEWPRNLKQGKVSYKSLTTILKERIFEVTMYLLSHFQSKHVFYVLDFAVRHSFYSFYKIRYAHVVPAINCKRRWLISETFTFTLAKSSKHKIVKSVV